MGELLSRALDGRRRALGVLTALCASLLTLGALPALAPAQSILRSEFAPFADCPVETAAICLVATTSSGEFVIDHKTVPIEKTITLQGGLATEAFTAQPLLGALDGNTLSKTPLTVPGGLVGIGGLGGEVTATAEIAGPVSSVIINKGNLLAQQGTAVTLPLKVKLSNEVLGEECYVGTDAEPIVLHLTTGTTSPPPPATPITGSRGTLEGKGKGRIVGATMTRSSTTAFRCLGPQAVAGASAVIDLAVDADVGIPTPAGLNTAVMNDALEGTTAAMRLGTKRSPERKKK